MSIVASHVRGKFLVDKISGASLKAKEAIKRYGRDKVINGTYGVLLDDDENLVCLPTVEKVLHSLSATEFIATAPICGLPEFLRDVIATTFEEYRPNAYIQAVATTGATGALHHAIWNYSEIGDTILTTDWFWSPYRVVCSGALRKLDVFTLLDDNFRFNIRDFEHKASNLIKNQDNLLVILNTPAHNPTGYSLSDSDWEAVIGVCRNFAQNKDKKITLVVDAAYLDYTDDRESRKFFQQFEKLPDNMFVILAVSLSKSLTLYGQRAGAMIGISSDRQTVEEFVNVNEYISRATWSEVNHGAMKTLITIYRDKALLSSLQNEREAYVRIIKERARLFIEKTRQADVKMLPYFGGFFVTIPVENPEEICNKLNDENIFLVPLDKGVRIAVCSIPTKQISWLATAITKVISESGE